MKSLQSQLDQIRVNSESRLPAETSAIMKQDAENLASSDILARNLKVGDMAPDFTLPNHKGETWQMSTALRNGPVVISFYRGGWCPYCNLELAALQAVLPEMKAAGASLIAISPESPDHTLSTADKNKLDFDVLSDHGNAVAKQFGLEFVVPEHLRPIYASFGLDLPAVNGDASFTLPLPATYVVAANGKVIYQFSDTDYVRRAEPADVLKALA
jgi:peroxiredoxin